MTKYSAAIWQIALDLKARLTADGATVDEKLDTGNLYDYTDIDDRCVELVSCMNGIEAWDDDNGFTDEYNEFWGIICEMTRSLMTK